MEVRVPGVTEFIVRIALNVPRIRVSRRLSMFAYNRNLQTIDLRVPERMLRW